MTEPFQGDSSQPPRLFLDAPKSEPEQPEPPMDTGDPAPESPEIPEASASEACRDISSESRNGVATCDPIHTVYLLRDRDGELLYVGVTLRAAERWKQHRKTKDWWGQVSSVDVEHFDTRGEAERRERELIKTLEPRFNIQHRRNQWWDSDETSPPCDEFECGNPAMEWVTPGDTAAWAFEHEGYVFSGYWYCDRCKDIDCHPAPPSYAALGLARDPVMRDLLAARRLRDTAAQLERPYHNRCTAAAFARMAEKP